MFESFFGELTADHALPDRTIVGVVARAAVARQFVRGFRIDILSFRAFHRFFFLWFLAFEVGMFSSICSKTTWAIDRQIVSNEVPRWSFPLKLIF